MSIHNFPRSSSSSQRPARIVRGPDRIGLVGFHEAAFVVSRPADAHAAWLQQRIQTLHQRMGATTNIAGGIRTATALLKGAPSSVLKRVWLLSDGYPTCDVDAIWNAADEARQAHINVNTIGIGDAFDESLLRRISSRTHRGRFVSVQSLRQLVDALVRNSGEPVRQWQGRTEYTVIAVDLSASMSEAMEGRTKIAVVQEAFRDVSRSMDLLRSLTDRHLACIESILGA